MSKRGAVAAVVFAISGVTTAATAVVDGVSAPADAVVCIPLAHASITPPSGRITAGSSVHVRATVSGMLLRAHLQISGPGLNEQLGPSTMSGTIDGDATVPRPGGYTLAVIGDGTGCVYRTSRFTVSARPSSKPTTHKTPGKGSAKPLPKAGTPGGVGGRPSGHGDPPDAGAWPGHTGATPSGPVSSVLGGAGAEFRYPSPDPEVAAPKAPQARDVAATRHVDWGRSVAIALVLVLLSAHLGMWSRRQRLAASRDAAGGRWVRLLMAARRSSAPIVAAPTPSQPRDGSL